MLVRAKHLAYQVLIAYIFVVAGCIVSCLQLLTFPVGWLGFLHVQRVLVRKLTYLHWNVIVGYSQWFSDLRVCVWCKDDELRMFQKENSILVANHKYQPDWITLYCLGQHLGTLVNFKSMAKHSLLYVPVIGWQFWLNDFVLVKRKLQDDKSTLQRSFKRFASYRTKFWLTVFCEGTRFTPEKHRVSVTYARNRGLTPLKHHLMPRTRGFAMLVNGMRDFVPAIYDATICFQGDHDPTLKEFLNCDTIQTDLLLRRIPIETVPKDDDDCAAFLNSLYENKDEMCEFHNRNKRFPVKAGEQLEGMSRVEVDRSISSLLVVVFWFVVLVLPLFMYVAYSLLVGSWTCLTTTLATSSALFYTFHLVVGSGKPQSNYGKSPTT